ncbi:MBL fold metallo-hydrolase, partial [Paenibacillus sepulcri]|nr:MBL fold metallo-hydrolase [Paenibacillus sepulcri]
MKLSDRVYLVGSGKYGMEMSDPMDCNVYLLDGGSECALIDAGGGIDPERIAANIQSCGFSMDQVRYCFLTHVHGDHAAGAYYFHNRYGVQIGASEEAAVWLAA